MHVLFLIGIIHRDVLEGKMKFQLLITTEPHEGTQDFAPKAFEGRGKVANVLDIIVYALRHDPDGGPITWCGRKIQSIEMWQKEE